MNAKKHLTDKRWHKRTTGQEKWFWGWLASLQTKRGKLNCHMAVLVQPQPQKPLVIFVRTCVT